MNLCPICDSELYDVFSARLLKKYDVVYRQCHGCRLLQTEEPFWLDEAYGEAIATADTGLVMRNFSIASKLVPLLFLYFKPKSMAFLDIAGGYGMLTRLMRDYGFHYYWDDKYCQNFLARGFEAEKATRPFAALTAFEVLEHVHDPLVFIQEKLNEYACRTLIFTTEIYDGTTAPNKDWWYYAFNTGQHICFYQLVTLEKIAERLNLKLYVLRGLYILTDRKLTLSPLLRILMGRISLIITLLIKKRLGSLTLADHFMLLAKKETNLTS